MTAPAPHASAHHAPHAPRRATILAAAVLLLAGLAAFSALGHDAPRLLAWAVLAERLILAGALAALYLLAAVGLGRLFRPLWPGAAHPILLQSAAGLAALLWLSHLLASLGLFARQAGSVFALVLLAALAAVALHQVITFLRRGGFEPRLHPLLLLSAPAAALLVIAASNPPGWLWNSEFGGYDALSYHLALPQEWLRDGRLAPLTHNVYSYLPSYLEAAFLHLACAAQSPPPADGAAWGLIAGEGYPIFAAQYLHAGIALLAAWAAAGAARVLAARCGFDERARAFAAAVAATLTLLTPWTIVTGSLAYNDLGVLFMLGASLVAAFDPALTPSRRGIVLGLLLGAACSIKPTALFMAAAPVALALALTQPPRAWPRLALAGAVAGLAMLAPWLVRNALASGNPVFPFAASLFASPDGSLGHWSAEQVARYSRGHAFDGSILDRLRLAAFPEPAAPGTATIARYRGLSHPNFGLFFLMLLPAALATLNAATRRTALLLIAMLAVQLAAWLSFTHIQSRFLLPLLPIGAVLVALALAGAKPRPLAATAAGVAALAQLAYAVAIFLTQRPLPGSALGRPNALLLPGINARTGTAAIGELAGAFQADRDAWLAQAPPEAFVNALFPGKTVYLLGGATPLYFAGSVRVNTTWDAWPLGDLIAAHPDDPAAWSAGLRAQGIDLVLVDLAEIERLHRSNWADPRVRVDDVTRWMQTSTTPVHAWPRAGVYLVIPGPPP